MSTEGLALDQANVARARALLRVFRSEFDPLPFAQQLEHRTPYGTAVKEVLDSALIPDEAEALVDEESARLSRLA